MNYVERNLLKNEEIVYRATLHWAVFLSAIVWAIIAILCNSIAADPELSNPLTFISGLIAIIRFIQALIKKYCSEYVLTTKRLIMKEGIISRRTIELMLTKTEGVSVDQSILERLLGFGTIRATTGGVINKYRFIADPIRFRNQINEQVDIAQRNVAVDTIDEGVVVTSERSVAGTTVKKSAANVLNQVGKVKSDVEELKELAELFRQGVISEDEFNKMKQKILDKE